MMKYIEKIEKFRIDINKLKSDYLKISSKIKQWSTDDPDLYDFRAICINQKPNDPKSITGGNIRGIYWTNPSEAWTEEQRLEKVDEASFTEICDIFKESYIEEIYNLLKSNWQIGRVRILLKPPRSCLSWHRDPEKRIHIPIITNPGCRMVIENESFHMPADGSIYITDNSKYHNFFNGGEKDRIHLVATLLE